MADMVPTRKRIIGGEQVFTLRIRAWFGGASAKREAQAREAGLKLL